MVLWRGRWHRGGCGERRPCTEDQGHERPGRTRSEARVEKSRSMVGLWITDDGSRPRMLYSVRIECSECASRIFVTFGDAQRQLPSRRFSMPDGRKPPWQQTDCHMSWKRSWSRMTARDGRLTQLLASRTIRARCGGTPRCARTGESVAQQSSDGFADTNAPGTAFRYGETRRAVPTGWLRKLPLTRNHFRLSAHARHRPITNALTGCVGWQPADDA